MDAGSLSPANILLDIFTQLLPRNGDWVKDFPDLVSRKEKRVSPPAGIRDLCELVKKASKYHPRVVVAVDALDECNKDREELLKHLRDLGQVEGISVFVTSRKEYDIDVAFQGLLSMSLADVRDKIDADMKAYINAEMQDRQGLVRLPDQLKEKVTTTLIEMAGGM